MAEHQTSQIHPAPSLQGRAGGESEFRGGGSDSCPFLTLVARDLLSKYGNNLSGLTVVFPGKRASLFMDQALARESDVPVWTPRYTTISDLFAQHSEYQLADPVECVCRLYRVYARQVPEPHTLDQFYGWGEVLLSDFDDIDKHMVDADRLFANIGDLKAMDSADYLTPEHEAALKSFFANFSIEAESQIKRRFLDLWRHMSAIYHDFKADLSSEGLLYEGALQREVAEHIDQHFAAADAGLYIFVGFNVLHEVEERLFDHLKREGRAHFYWDYDLYYTQATDIPSEAGHFIRRNLARYGNELPPECFDQFRQPKELQCVAASSENAQARFVAQWLEEHRPEADKANRTAVVLCNEALLNPVLHSLPTDLPINITMGYPLVETPVHSLVICLLNLQTDGWDEHRSRFRSVQVQTLRTHPLGHLIPEEIWLRRVGEGSELLLYLQEVLKTLSIQPSMNSDETIVLTEALFRCYECIGVLLRLTEGERPLLQVSSFTLRRLLRGVLRSASIPFHGEPAIGLQVMGVLETRVLDFDQLLMLSVGEGFLPRSVSDTTLIPYALKEAFGLTTIRHQMAVYAYYFYRLVSRVRHVTFVYNSSNAGTRQNEMSRFLRQLMADPELPITHCQLVSGSTVRNIEPAAQQKTPDVLERLYGLFDNRRIAPDERLHLLSPTAINTYTTCPLQFYNKYVRGLRVNPTAADGLDAAVFGNIFHKAAQLLYEDFRIRSSEVRKQDIDFMLEAPEARVAAYIDKAFRLEYFDKRGERPAYEGLLIIARRVLLTYLVRLLRHDRNLTPFRIIGLEHYVSELLEDDALEPLIATGGIIDRLDEITDPNTHERVVRVVDYKTGSRPQSVTTMDRLFADTGQTEHYYFQTILYATIVSRQMGCGVQPALFFVHKSSAEDYSPKLTLARQTIHDVTPLADDFRDATLTVVANIFDPDIPFIPTQNTKHCNTCPYKLLCGR